MDLLRPYKKPTLQFFESGDLGDEGGDKGDEGYDHGYVAGVEAHGVGGDGQHGCVARQAYESAPLLGEHERGAEGHAGQAAGHCNQPAFYHEDATDKGGRCSESSHRGHVAALLDYEQRERGYYVEAGYHHYEGEHEEGNPFFDAYHAEGVGLLLHAGEYQIFVGGEHVGQGATHLLGVGAGSKTQFDGRGFAAVVFEQGAHVGQGQNHAVGVVFLLVDSEHSCYYGARRAEGSGGVGGVDAACAPGHVYVYRR